MGVRREKRKDSIELVRQRREETVREEEDGEREDGP